LNIERENITIAEDTDFKDYFPFPPSPNFDEIQSFLSHNRKRTEIDENLNEKKFNSTIENGALMNEKESIPV
jgi:hypothetical protein